MTTAHPTESSGHRITDAFRARFGSDPTFTARAPGRVNLIGEHTDYNDGFVLPMAIDRALWIAARRREDRVVRLHALDAEDVIEFSLEAFKQGARGPAEYVKGVAWALEDNGARLNGFEGVLLGDIPIGAGLSSSAALEIATARMFCAVSNMPWEPLAIARLAQRAENTWVGVRCGIMDQLSSAMGQAGHAVLIDCRSLSTQPAPLPDGLATVIMDTGIRRELTSSAYNDRRSACEAAALRLGVPALRDIDALAFERRHAELDPILQKRARHVVTENARTLAFYQALLAEDRNSLGELMRDSHLSLRDDFQVSCDELDLIVDLATQYPACLGARLTGAGFGGCAIALVQEDELVPFTDFVSSSYQSVTGIDAQLYPTRAASGASLSAG